MGDTIQSIAVFKAMCIELNEEKRKEEREGRERKKRQGKEGRGGEGKMRGLENGTLEW